MVFKCQEDSFLKEFSSKVISCTKTSDLYEVILEDTILFPEGGGQPSDHGYLNDHEVTKIVRREDKAIHLLDKPLTIGEEVKQTIDWNRRFDHMQQHSGQHLLSAVLERQFNYTTVSWWLGEDTCYVELDTPTISNADVTKAEDIVNQAIRDNRTVTVKILKESTSEEDLQEFRSVRGLPADHKGDIRVIVIDEIDSNMCCGTHVSNLGQLQAIKLLHSEKSKRKNQTLLHFIVGNRVLKRLETSIQREQKLVALLKSNPSEHVDLVDKLLRNVKLLNKNLQSVLKELAIIEANKLAALDPPPKYFILHKKEAEPDFMNIFIKEFGRKDVFLFLSTGEEKGAGNIVLHGDEKTIAELGPKMSEILKGKGAGKGNKYQAKVNDLSQRKKAEQLIKEYFTD